MPQQKVRQVKVGWKCPRFLWFPAISCPKTGFESNRDFFRSFFFLSMFSYAFTCLSMLWDNWFGNLEITHHKLHVFKFSLILCYTMHTVSFDWFLTSLERIINLEFYYQNFWHFTKNHYGITDLGLTLPLFVFIGLWLDIFDQTYLNTGLKKLKMWKS